MDLSNPHRSESSKPSSAWVSTRSPPVAVNRRRGGLAGREGPPVDRPVRRRRRAPQRPKPLIFPSSPTDDSPSPPRSASRISLPILLGQYGNLRPRLPEWPEIGWSPPLPLVVYERQSLILELTPSPPHGVDDGPPRSRMATPHRATDRPARPWRLPDAFYCDQSPNVESPPQLPPPLAVEEEGPKDNESVATPPVYYYRNGMPIYFPFHPTIEEWAACESPANWEIEAKGFGGNLSPLPDSIFD